jgi:hypothetical protein
MKIVNLLAALSLSTIGFSQYFNVYPDFVSVDSNVNQVNYLIKGIQNFDTTGVLYAELLENNDSLDLVQSVIVDLSDISSQPLFTSLADNRFSLNLGSYSSSNYIVHLWIIKEGEVFDEVYLNN